LEKIAFYISNTKKAKITLISFKVKL
jgi:hypothetical protein